MRFPLKACFSARVASEADYNIGTGAGILAAKWNVVPAIGELGENPREDRVPVLSSPQPARDPQPDQIGVGALGEPAPPHGHG